VVNTAQSTSEELYAWCVQPQVHCQGGKGRTGTFCVALLLWTGFCTSATEALDFYARRRTDPRLGRRSLQVISISVYINKMKQ
jgi:hypothetical protein